MAQQLRPDLCSCVRSFTSDYVETDHVDLGQLDTITWGERKGQVGEYSDIGGSEASRWT